VKILLTGVSGQVGAHLLPRLVAAGHDVVAQDRTQFDLSQPDSLVEVIDRVAPDVLINPAAYTAVDKAESEQTLAHTVNADAVAAMARVCARRGVLLVHLSTDYVFNGESVQPWLETDQTSPISTYGATKLAGERAIADSGASAIILRTSWVYSRMGRNFLLTMQKLAAERDELRVVADQHGTPNWAGTLADAIVHTLAFSMSDLRQKCGIYHLTSRGATTWHGFASAIVASGGRKLPVRPITTAEFPTPAKRPAYSVLNGEKFERAFSYAMPTWESGLMACLRADAPMA
jgi:dTDP-4-dehydrorhamnose reductase